MLWVAATPVGNPDDLSISALRLLQECDVIICESTKETSKLLRHHGVTGRTYEVLDEHSKPEDVEQLAELCRDKNVILVSDGGTPAFCDPGAHLVARCRALNIPAKPVLGPSALMGLLSMAGARIDQFVFRGFPPAETEARKKAFLEMQKEKRAMILMDTPYRMKKILAEVEEFFPRRQIFLARDLSLPEERFLHGTPASVRQACRDDKAEFMLLIYADV